MRRGIQTIVVAFLVTFVAGFVAFADGLSALLFYNAFTVRGFVAYLAFGPVYHGALRALLASVIGTVAAVVLLAVQSWRSTSWPSWSIVGVAAVTGIAIFGVILSSAQSTVSYATTDYHYPRLGTNVLTGECMVRSGPSTGMNARPWYMQGSCDLSGSELRDFLARQDRFGFRCEELCQERAEQEFCEAGFENLHRIDSQVDEPVSCDFFTDCQAITCG